MSYSFEHECTGKFHAPFSFGGFRFPHLTIRRTLHPGFLHDHTCSIAAVTTQITTNTETTAIPAVTPELKELGEPASLFPDESVCPGFIVTVIVGDVKLSMCKVLTVSPIEETSSTGIAAIVRVYAAASAGASKINIGRK